MCVVKRPTHGDFRAKNIQKTYFSLKRVDFRLLRSFQNLDSFNKANNSNIYMAHISEETNFKHLFGGFLSSKEIIEDWKNVGVEQQSEYEWDLLKIGNIPWMGGIYISYKKDTQGYIYWVRDTGYDIKNNDIEGIRLITTDIYEYVNGLYLSNVEDEELIH